jgi:hypothetical protein
MRETLLTDSLSPLARLSETEGMPQIRRRQFLKIVGVAGVGLALSSKALFAQPTDVSLWVEHVAGLVYSICPDQRVSQSINSRLYRAQLKYAPRATDFHSYFSAPYVFADTTISPEKAICGNGFEVNQFPYYDIACPCGGHNDLNAPEIRRITNDKEKEFYGCVLAPTSQRMSMEPRDHAGFLRTVSSYPYDPNDFNVPYKRVFSSSEGQSYYGYNIVHKTLVGSNGKPMGDMLLSSYPIRG